MSRVPLLPSERLNPEERPSRVEWFSKLVLDLWTHLVAFVLGIIAGAIIAGGMRSW